MVIGRFDPDEQHIPFDMFARSSGPSSGEGLVQQHEIGNLMDLCQEPVGKGTTAGAGNLIPQQLD